MGERVLIVDDHEEFRALARALLEAEGFEVVGEAVDGAETLAAVERVPFSQAAGQRQVAASDLWFAPTGGDEQRLTRILAPTLIAAGALDVHVPVANARLLHSRIRASQLLIYADAGHAFLIQHVTAFAAAVRRFLG